MRVLESRMFCVVLWLASLPLLGLACGCHSTPKPLFVVSGPGWHVQEGQTLWRPRHGYPEIGGDVLLASHEDGRCLIQFAKTPVSLVLAQTTRTNWLIQFPPARMSFSGHRKPPTRFAWLYLHAALSGQQLDPPLRFEREPEGGWRLENTRSGETLRGFLAP
ncbi:MAG: hypothetical protein ACLQU3_10220 [Limisphaerales bacterium]